MFNVLLNTRQRIVGTFRNAAGVLVDPTAVCVVVSWPPRPGKAGYDEVLRYGESSRVVRQSVGVYYVSILVDVPGELRFTWRSTAVGQESRAVEVMRVVF